jgi:acetolactate synthase-1/2/3 large subunit
MRMKVSDYIADFLRVQEIEHVFEVAGGMITHILDSIYRIGNTNIISVHHEQAAAFAADAYGRMTGKPGVALATSGPGATNLLTGIASCYFDSSPALFITGQVNVHEQKGTRKIRQLGFQETDIHAMVQPIIKQCFSIEIAEQVESVLKAAYECAISGRPGPVLIDLPMNIQRAEIEVSPIEVITRKKTISVDLNQSIDALSGAIKKSRRPLILLGRGIQCAFAEKEALCFAEHLQIPVVTSLLALDTIPYDHPLRAGFIGTYGNRWSNLAIGNADLLIVIGSRLDIRQTGADIDGFRNNKTIFHIDCDEGEINNRVPECISIIADAKEFLLQANARLGIESFLPPTDWLNEIDYLRNKWPDAHELKDFSGINPNHFMHELSQCSGDAVAFVVDVGSHQMWAAQSLEIQANQSFITSGGMGAMGFALPAAIGASLANAKKPVVVIAGDGAFQLNLQELQTVVRNRLPIKIVILNNECLGMIRQFQDSYFEGRYQSTYWGYTAPDFAAIAEAYGIPAKTISTPAEVNAGANWLWEENTGPMLLQVMVSPHMNVYPKIAFGKPITEMEPFATPISIEST